MGKTLEDAGLLVKDSSGTLKVSEPTTRKFLKIRNEKIDQGNLKSPKIFFEDKEKRKISLQDNIVSIMEKEKRLQGVYKKYVDKIEELEKL